MSLSVNAPVIHAGKQTRLLPTRPFGTHGCIIDSTAQFQKSVFLALRVVNVTPPDGEVNRAWLMLAYGQQCMQSTKVTGRVWTTQCSEFWEFEERRSDPGHAAAAPVVMPSRDPMEVIVIDLGK